jgi:hypothetical protein
MSWTTSKLKCLRIKGLNHHSEKATHRIETNSCKPHINPNYRVNIWYKKRTPTTKQQNTSNPIEKIGNRFPNNIYKWP